MQPPLEMTIAATVRTAEYVAHGLAVRLGYSPDDPLALWMDLYVTGAELPDATWVFGRDLLATGLILPTGEGDVRVRPHGEDETDVELVSGRTWCVVRLAADDVRDFVARTRTADEHSDEKVATALDRILAETLRPGTRNTDSRPPHL
ncbi:SsgA family sporulation/cell division regulator [Streptomyces sp. NRRL B-1347]|uniref:SsgA family sporulation/cell division regulator n=1 Tax=Streptomyces sp. NRRL B-1347 TaxID=1476877 RepID=UPI00068AD304|nr:SsgA family sporulation/cell division regulator [Streptomyces sp. NRRL B-1347]